MTRRHEVAPTRARSLSARLRRATKALGTMALGTLVVLTSLVLPTTAASALEPAALRNTKTASATDLVAGESFNWVIEVGCSVLSDECVNAVLTDTIPSEFIVGNASSILVTGAITPAEYVIAVSGQDIRIDFKQPLVSPIGATGLKNGIVTITVPVTVRSDLDYTPVPIDVSNTSIISADNAPSIPSTATVNITVPLRLATVPTKSFSPASNIISAGVPTTLTVSAANTSNGPINTFTVQDPVDPSTAAIFSNVLAIQNPLGAVTWPAGATSAVVSVWDASATPAGWVAADPVAVGNPLAFPAGVTPANVRGVRIAFSSGADPLIPRSATASFELALQNRAGLTPGAKPNTAQSTVEITGQVPVTATTTANYTVTSATTSVGAVKDITPGQLATIALGGSNLTKAVVTLTGRNTGTVPLKSLTITEPSASSSSSSTPLAYNDPSNPLSPNELRGGGGLIFEGFTSGVLWPSGATAVEVRYYYADGTDSTATGTTPNQLPAPTAGQRVTGFVATFTGTIPASANAILPFTVQANPAQVTQLSIDYTNRVRVAGIDVYDAVAPAAYAFDDVTVFADQVAVTTSKSNTRAELLAQPGQSTTVTLGGRILPYPQSTRVSDRFEISDPSAATGLTEWYKYFNATGIVATGVPGGSTLTVQYRDSAGVYTDMPGFIDLPGGATYTQSFPSALLDNIYGIKLIWESTTGYNPNQQFTGNVGFALRSILRDTTTPLPNVDLTAVLENCSAAQASTSTINSNLAVSDPCRKVNLKATTGGGGANLLDKNFINVSNTNAQDIITTRNNSQTRVRLNWSTAGYSNVQSMVVYDGPVDASGNPDPSLWNQRGTWDAFDLAQIPAINTALDPLIQYDRVSWELYNKNTGVWETPTGWPCTLATPCAGLTAVRNLTTTERANYVAIRFTFTERPGRTVLDPAPGSGVAASNTNNRRIDLVFQLRNTLRSDATVPVVNGYQYNVPITAPASSVVLNGSHALATLATSTLTDRASDTITLQDANLAVAVTKNWGGGDLPIPDGTETGPRPSSRVTITATNQTPAIVSSLTIEEPNPGSTSPNDSPFDEFDLQRFQSFSPPTNATGLTVTVFRPASAGGDLVATGTPTVAQNAALAWDASQLAAATGFKLEYTGPIPATNGAATVLFDLVLRTNHRDAPFGPVGIVDSPVRNSTQATVGDVRYNTASPVTAPTFSIATLSARNQASKNLFLSSISVTTSKTFAPASQLEGSPTPITMTLTATPGGTERVKSLVVTDDRASFWNAFDFVGKGTITLPVFSPTITTSATTLRTDICITRNDLTAETVAANPAASCTDTGGTWVIGTPQLQAAISASPTAIIPAPYTAADVQGIRFTVERADGSQWENPQAPVLTFPLSVQRRVDLRTGGPVQTDYVDNVPAPGETVKGTTTNTVNAAIEGIWGKRATASATRTYLYQHALTSVEVLKTPTGAKAPGQIFYYVLSVRNTGGWPIVNPVITDYLPTDALGAMLIFDPDNPVVVYNYQLTGAAPATPNGTPLPSGTSGMTGLEPTVVESGPGPEKLTFTFPGTPSAPPVLEVGQTYTITIPMMFRPGLTYSTNVSNEFGIKGDRKFNTCTAPPGSTARLATSGATNECITGTVVRPAEQPALRALITVKAIVDEPTFPDQGYTGGADCAAEVDAAGFSRLPCIPLTLPGQKEIWRLTAQNTGTTDMPRLVLAMRLPTPGDKTILDSFVRQSAWTAEFADQISANLGIPGATVTPYYSTGSTLCTAVLVNPSNIGGCTTGWEPWTAGTLPDPTVVTALQFVIDFPSSNYLSPGELITIDITTRTAALAATPGADSTANNSLSASALTVTGTVVTSVTALDYSRVSVALATGGVRLTKAALAGPGASFVPSGQLFSGNLVCTSVGQVTTRPFSITAGQTVQFDNLPGGASCTATETSASGQTSYTATTVIVDPRIDIASLPTVELVNTYELASLSVSKEATTTAPVVPTAFAFEVECTFLGQPLTLAAGDAAFTLDAGGAAKVITGIPANSTCVVEETDARGADATIISAQTTPNRGGSVSIDNAARTVTFTNMSPDTTGSVTTNTTVFDNRFDALPALVINKELDGAAAAQFGEPKTFSIDVLCTFNGSMQYDGTVELDSATGFTATIEDLITGSRCELTEPDRQGADAVVFEPNDGDESTGFVIIPASTTPVVTVTATNWYLTGSVEITKVFAGDEDAIDKFGLDPDAEYEFELVCTREGRIVDLDDPFRTVDAQNLTVRYTTIASGAECVLSESDPDGASSWQILDENGDPVVDGEFTITVNPTILSVADQAQSPLEVENTFRLAEVTVAKTVFPPVIGPDGQPVSFGLFEFELECTLAGREIIPAEDPIQLVADGDSFTWTELAEGADCSVTETDTRNALITEYRITGADGIRGTFGTGVTAELAPLRPTDAIAPNRVQFFNSYADLPTLALTGVDGTRLLLLPLLLLFAGLALVFWQLRRRRSESAARADGGALTAGN